MALDGLVAYPARPSQIGNTISSALATLKTRGRVVRLETWEELDVCGHFIRSTILGKIDASALLVADVTFPNFNVAFEIGYAIGRQKPIVLIRHAALDRPDETMREIGLFDTLGYSGYSTSGDLIGILQGISNPTPLGMPSDLPSRTPVYLLMPRVKTDPEIRVQARIKKLRLPFRTFDPEEHGRLAGPEAVEEVGRSYGVVVPLISSNRSGAQVHNVRGAFVAGLAIAMGKAFLLLQEGDDPVPLDYRDLVTRYWSLQQIDEHMAELASQVTERLLEGSSAAVPEPRSFLERLDLGASSAENEMRDLASYYLETDEYQRTLRGEVRVVAGRKGSGKTAMFVRIRDRLRQDKTRIVLDLKPEGFQLLKFKERVLDYLDAGSREHTITAFWEYLLLLEAAHKILQKDHQRHLRDTRLYEPYQRLSHLYAANFAWHEADFSERMLVLTERIAKNFLAGAPSEGSVTLSTGQLTEILHEHDVAELGRCLAEYLEFKNGLWILFDNLDKGWPPHGVTETDVLTLRCLLDAISKLERLLNRAEVDCHGVVFVRNDVYELLQANTPDRGKVTQVILDWTDPGLLRELVRKRLVYNGLEGDPVFDELWPQVCASHFQGEESSQYMIERSVMRPRALLDFIRFCRAHAVNMRHPKIEAEDIAHGEENYSAEMLNNLGFEIQDVMPKAKDVLYEFVEEGSVLSQDRVEDLLNPKVGEEWTRLLDILLWYGFLGIIRDGGDATYIYDVRYDAKRLKALATKQGNGTLMFQINPAFWKALEVRNSREGQIGMSLG